jgi:hypothetical protein
MSSSIFSLLFLLYRSDNVSLLNRFLVWGS